MFIFNNFFTLTSKCWVDVLRSLNAISEQFHIDTLALDKVAERKLYFELVGSVYVASFVFVKGLKVLNADSCLNV